VILPKPTKSIKHPDLKIKLPDHDDDEEEEEDFVFPHVQLAGLLSGAAEEDIAEGMDQLQEEERQTEDKIDQVVRSDDLSKFFGSKLEKLSKSTHFEGN
jgi:hypothetical protein